MTQHNNTQYNDTQHIVAQHNNNPAQENIVCGQFVEQMFILNSSFRCDQMYKYERYYFGCAT